MVSSYHPEIVAAPGYRVHTSRQDTPNSAVVTPAEAGVLQGFPADYPWAGGATAAYRQVGNAFPPPVAKAVLEELC
jgi:DNA (cytosine-5)-methyltransferase 1